MLLDRGCQTAPPLSPVLNQILNIGIKLELDSSIDTRILISNTTVSHAIMILDNFYSAIT